MKERIKYDNQKTVIITTIISVLILITIQIFFEKSSDVLGLSNIEQKSLWISENMVNIIIPLLIIVAVFLKKTLMCIFALGIRSLLSCVPIVIYAVENNQINKMEIGTIILNIVYVTILILMCLKKNCGREVIFAIIITRIMCIIFNGSLWNLLYGLENGGVYLLYNMVQLIFSELIFILPIIYYNKIIISYLGMAIDNN